MRPIEKKKPGETVEYVTSRNIKVEHKIQKEYKDYSDAKEPLAANIGKFCSYCEEARALGDIHVEHIAPKSKDGALCDWENFLLSCNICNSVKLTKDVNIEDIHFPHRDNTYLDFIYDESGRVKINPDLPPEEYSKAEKLYDIVKLKRDPSEKDTPSTSDFRWQHRLETWETAKRALGKYESGKNDLEDILDLVKTRGNWSIWFTVFKGHDEVRKALIENTPGTCAECFDAENHYEPMPRKRVE